ncbi:MAG: DUF1640 domain-containing protein [Gammaproteobacteria bacterium]|nr:DUF1640 domain-containing protein [Gammaproteobacteria bacterium]
MSAMVVTAIDALRYARRLKEAGVPTEQAEAMADAIGAELVEQLATKSDLEALRLELKAEIDQTRTSLGGKILLLQWMLGFVLAGVVTLLWRVFS